MAFFCRFWFQSKILPSRKTLIKSLIKFVDSLNTSSWNHLMSRLYSRQTLRCCNTSTMQLQTISNDNLYKFENGLSYLVFHFYVTIIREKYENEDIWKNHDWVCATYSYILARWCINNWLERRKVYNRVATETIREANLIHLMLLLANIHYLPSMHCAS